MEDLVAIFYTFLGGKSRVTSFIARPGGGGRGVEIKWNGHEYIWFFLLYLSFQKNDHVNLLASFRSTP